MRTVKGWLAFIMLMFAGGGILVFLHEHADPAFRFYKKPSEITWAGFIICQILVVAFMFFKEARAAGVALCAVSLPYLWYLIDKPLIQDRMTRLQIELFLESLGWH